MADELISREAFKKALLTGAEYLDEDTLMTVKNILDTFPIANAVVLPCKVGDTVWVVFANGIRPYVVDRIHIMANNQVNVRMRFMAIETLYQMEDNFGKTVFLTREEAEKALGERKEDNA